MTTFHQPISIEEIRCAQKRISEAITRTPLVRLNISDAPAEIYLKLETLQTIGSFKVRGATNAIALADDRELEDGVWTASTGNMAQAVAMAARERGLACSVVVPEGTSRAKLDAVDGYGAAVVTVPQEDWFELVFSGKGREAFGGMFIHPVSNRGVMAGHGTIGLEILDDLPDVDAVITPYGGGGLSCGVASAVKALKPDIRCYACELERGAPVAPSLAAGERVTIEPIPAPAFTGGFSGTPSVIPEMWPLVKELLDGSLLMSVDEIVSAIKLLVEKNHIVAEGAGAAPVAAAIAGRAGPGKVACVITGGHIDTDVLADILLDSYCE